MTIAARRRLAIAAVCAATACAPARPVAAPRAARDVPAAPIAASTPAAAPAPVAARVPAAAPVPVPVPAPPRIRPEDTAGLYWQPYATCHDCDAPAAIVAYVTPAPAVARRIVAALDGALGLGLPYVIHTDEIGVGPRGIAVVTGSYATLAAARAAAARTRAIAGRRAIAIALAGDPGATHTPEAPRHVTVVDRGRAVPAWSKADLDAAGRAMDASADPAVWQSLAAQRRWLRSALDQRTPACTVRPGDLFVVEARDLDGYAFAPVRCGGKLAYIEWTASLLGHAVIVPDGDGHRLEQVVGAECDRPTIETWRYDRDGRHPAAAEPTLVARGGC